MQGQMNQSFTLQLLQELGGRAKLEQLKELAYKKDLLGYHKNMRKDLWALRRWRMIEFDDKHKEWSIPASS
jgi:hypothetical protein